MVGTRPPMPWLPIITNTLYMNTIKRNQAGEEDKYFRRAANILRGYENSVNSILKTIRFDTNIGQASTPDDKLIVNLYDGGSSVFRRTKHPFIGIGYSQWSFIVMLEELYQLIKQKIEQNPGIKNILVIGLCKDSVAAAYTALSLNRDFPHFGVGVFGAPWLGEWRTGKQMCGNVLVSPTHERVREQQPYKGLFQLFGDPFTMLEECQKEGLNIHAFSFYAINENCKYEENNACRLGPFLNKKYVFLSKADEAFPGIHTKILKIVKNLPEVFERWIDGMFEIIEKQPTDARLCSEFLEG